MWRRDRPGRSRKQVIKTVTHLSERDVIQERTLAGLEAARARGKKGGRPKVTETIKPRSLALAKQLYAAREKSVAQIMEQTGFKSRSTFYKYVVETLK